MLCLWPSSFLKFPYLPVYFPEKKTIFCWKIQDCRWLTITTGTPLGNTSTTGQCTDMFEYYVKLLFFLSQKDNKLAHMLSKWINLICKTVMRSGMGRSGGHTFVLDWLVWLEPNEIFEVSCDVLLHPIHAANSFPYVSYYWFLLVNQ